MVSKSKLMVGLLAVFAMLAFASSSFAQINITITPVPSAGEIGTNVVAYAADTTSSGAGIQVTGAFLATANQSTATDLLIQFPTQITDSTSLPTGQPIQIAGATGSFTGVVISTVGYTTGLLRLTLPINTTGPGIGGPLGNANQSGSFRIIGVRLNASTLTLGSPVTATFSLSNTANNWILSTASANVITNLAAGVSSLVIGTQATSVASNGTFQMTTAAGATDSTASFALTEGCASCWRITSQEPGATQSTQIRLTFAGVPAGLTLTLTATGTGTASAGTLFTVTPSVTSITASALTTNLVLTGSATAPSQTAVDKIGIGVTAAAGSTATSLAAATITVTATMFPIGIPLEATAVATINTPITDTGFPRFIQADVGPLTIGSVVSASTTLLIPFGLVSSGFDTGIALANTTLDPIGGSTLGGATSGTGTITVTMYPTVTATGAAGTAGSFTTSSTKKPGVGLLTDGTLAAGALWRVNASELAAAAGITFDSGYIFYQTNFVGAHGAAYVYGPGFVSNVGVLVLPPPGSSNPRSAESGLNN